VVVADARAPRDGAFVDQIGFYNPLTDPATYRIDVARAQHWVDHGAQATEAAARLLHRSGVKLRQAVPAEWTGPSATEGA
jgi:small subunit ribosomal protein S16